MKVSSGQLDVSKEKNLMVWGLGKRCAPEHQCQITSTAAVYLKKKLMRSFPLADN